jgi:hypothetical protein
MQSYVHLDYLVVAFIKPFGRSLVDNERFLFEDVVNAHNRIFSEVKKVIWLESTRESTIRREVCEIRMSPSSSILSPMLVHMKFSNKALYCYDLTAFMRDFYFDFGFVYSHIVRVDICCDFVTFSNQLKPSNFISGLLSGKYYRIGKGEFKVYGENASVNRDGLVNRHSFHSVTWGKITSGVQTCLYNKSLEMRTGKIKPWIVDWWKRCGLDYTTSDVWRLEFRIQGSSVKLLQSPSFLVNLAWYHLVDSGSFLVSVFRGLYDKYFDVRKLSGRSRVYDLPTMSLLSFSVPPAQVERRVVVVERAVSERSVKTALSLLRSLSMSIQSDYIRNLSSEIDRYVSSLLPYCSTDSVELRYADYVDSLQMSRRLPRTFDASISVRTLFDIHEEETSNPRPS